MEVRVNREVLNQLLLELGVPEKKIKSLKVVIWQKPEKAGLLERLRASAGRILRGGYVTLGEYNSWRNTLTIYLYPWRSRKGIIYTIAHEASHVKGGWRHHILLVAMIQLLAVLLGVIPVPIYFLIWRHINNAIWQLASLLPLLGWLVLVEQVTRYLRRRSPYEQEAEKFAKEALLDPRWRKVIKIKRDRKPQS